MLTSATFHQLYNRKRYSLHQGGTRSGKTYGILQGLLLMAIERPLTIDVYRKFSRTHDKGALPDFQKILAETNAKYTYNAVAKTYAIGESVIRFGGADEIAKLRGPQRDIAFLNEATEFTIDAFDEINQRTKERVIMDFNPWAKSHWLYQMKARYPGEVAFYKTTYKDNSALSQAQIRAIEAYQKNDPEKWAIYGLGERVIPQELIYRHYVHISQAPEGHKVYGIDFGSTSPTAMVEVTFSNDAMYIRECLYERNLSTADMVAKVKAIVGSSVVWCDAAEPDRIKELQANGVQARAASKDVQAGIGAVKNYPLYLVVGEGIGDNLVKEIDSYSWRRNVQTGMLMDEVVKHDDHLMDAMRYAIYNEWGKTKGPIAVNTPPPFEKYGHYSNIW